MVTELQQDGNLEVPLLMYICMGIWQLWLSIQELVSPVDGQFARVLVPEDEDRFVLRMRGGGGAVARYRSLLSGHRNNLMFCHYDKVT